MRFAQSQKNRTIIHPNLDQASQKRRLVAQHSFVVCADTQLGLTSANKEWETELAYARFAVRQINSLEPRPAFCCCCGDLVDMEYTFNRDRPKEECHEIQDRQNEDFKKVWSKLHPDIGMVCVCGNHDVGNKPSPESIGRFTKAFGDDFLAFWCNGTYNIVLNSNLFADPSGAYHLYEEQLRWLEDRLEHAKEHNAAHIFVFMHHPWFLYKEDEHEKDVGSRSWLMPPHREVFPNGFPDNYFIIPKQYRMKPLELFEKYGVTAAFSGHFHQNMVTKASFGMDMIITSSLSAVFESNGKPDDFDEPGTRGIRIVDVQAPLETNERGAFTHKFVSLKEE